MPLVSKLPPPGVDVKSSLENLQSSALQAKRQQRHSSDTDEKDSGYEDFDKEDDCFDSDMESSVTKESRLEKQPKDQTLAPAIPQRNERRASRMLDTMLLELANLDGATNKDLETKVVLPEQDPHEKYLSSEEDASLSDDYDDSLLDTDMEDFDEDCEEGLDSRPSSRKSQEDTARVVSFTLIGKSQIVEIYLHSPTERGRHSVRLENLTSTTKPSPKPRARRPSPLKLVQSNNDKRISIVSIASTATTLAPSPAYSTSYIAPKPNPTVVAVPPVRKSSRLASLKTSLSQHSLLMNHANTVLTATPPVYTPATQTEHSFLNMDPFEAAHYQSPTQDEHPVPKTPIGMTSSAWKNALSKGGLSRTLSRARKPSMPKINAAYASGVLPVKNESNASTTNLSIHSVDVGEQPVHLLHKRSSTMPISMMIGEQPSTGSTQSEKQEELKKVARPPVVEQQQRGGLFRMGLGRKKTKT